MKIDRIELHYVKIPLQDRKPGFFAQPAYFTPNWIPGFRQSEVRFYLLRLGTDEGVEGYAAMPAMGPERRGLGSMLGNYLMGINPMDIRLVNQRIQEFSYIGMRNGWIDAAFWDIIGKVRREPVWKILGGSGGHVYPYLSTGSNHGHDPVKIGEIVSHAMESGYRGVKLRVKSDELAPMLDMIAAARETAGDSLDLMVDANQGWPVDLFDETPKWTLEFARQFATGIEQYDVRWLEEPLNRGDFAGLAALRRSTSTPIAGGELNGSWHDFKNMLELGSLDVYQPDAVLVDGSWAGGISMVHWLIREIQKRNSDSDAEDKLKFCPHTWTTGLGFAVALQLVGVLPAEQRSLLEYPLDGHWQPAYWARFIESGFPIDADGRLKIPDEPGLGVGIDMNAIRRFGQRIYHGTPARVAISTLRDRGLKQSLYLKSKRQTQIERTARAGFRLPEPPF